MPLLVLANKQDIPTAARPEDIKAQIDASVWKGRRFIFHACTRTDAEELATIFAAYAEFFVSGSA